MSQKGILVRTKAVDRIDWCW